MVRSILLLTTFAAAVANPKCCSCKIMVDHLVGLAPDDCSAVDSVIGTLCRGNEACKETVENICEKVLAEIKAGTDPSMICGPIDLGFCDSTTDHPTPVSPLVEMAHRQLEELQADPITLETPNFCGGCAVTYQSCCVAYGAAGSPCTCHLKNPQDTTDSCGDCGCAWEWCCHSTTSDPQGKCKCSLGP